ncbi:phosphatidylinositol kinase- protein kinase tor1, partial [Coemansia aciculifera]
YKWAIGERRDALQMIETFARDYSSKVGFDLQAPEAFADHIDARVLESYNGHMGVADDSKTIHFLSRFYFKRAEWLAKIEQQHLLVQEARTKAGLGHRDELHSLRQSNRASTNARRSVRGSASACSGANGAIMASSSGVALAGDRGSQMDQDCEYLYKLKGDRIKEMILESYHAATVLDSKWYKAWHSLALRHFFETQQYSEEHSSVTEDIIEKHVVPAVDGFFRAIQLSKGDTTLQDTLRLLTAWFNYSKYERVAQAVQDRFNTVSIRTWLQVIPQILARIQIKSEGSSRLIKQLLVKVGKSHPHAILFSLYVAARSDHLKRSQAAKEVLVKLHDRMPEMVEETEIVSRELIRITLLLPELWQEGLDNAFKCYYVQNDPVEMMTILKHLHKLTCNPQTLHELRFVQVFGTELAVAEEQMARYFEGAPGPEKDAFIQQAWESYCRILTRIQKLFPDPTLLALKDTAPTLLLCHDMHLT